MGTFNRYLQNVLVLSMFGTAFSWFAPAIGGANLFPAPAAIQPAVQFWLSIYTHYDLTQGVVHDSRNPEIIYGVIDLKHPDAAGARRSNDRRMQQARNRYRQVLDQLSRHPEGKDPESIRVAGLFKKKVTPNQYQSAKRRIRCQVGQRDRFRDGLIRSAPYISAIQATFREAGLPEDLAYLPHVESSFNYQAYSKSGAAGIWQFTRRTGRHFLSINHVLDERLDPLRSSEAAAALLKANYRRLDSWPLAITAYNHGISGMLRAKRRHGSYSNIYEKYRTRRFRFASRNFYPEFLAAREAAVNSHRYFHDLPSASERQAFHIVSDGFVAFDAVAKHFRLPPDTLRQFNLALRPSVLRGLQDIPKGYRLNLPAHEWQTHLAYNARLPQTILTSQQKPCPTYRVRRGDTISAIASRHNIRIADIVAANNLTKRGNRIYVNQKLKIPINRRSL